MPIPSSVCSFPVPITALNVVENILYNLRSYYEAFDSVHNFFFKRITSGSAGAHLPWKQGDFIKSLHTLISPLPDNCTKKVQSPPPRGLGQAVCLCFSVFLLFWFSWKCASEIIKPVLMSHGNFTFSPFLQHRQEVPAPILNFTLKRASLPSEATQTWESVKKMIWEW